MDLTSPCSVFMTTCCQWWDGVVHFPLPLARCQLGPLQGPALNPYCFPYPLPKAPRYFPYWEPFPLQCWKLLHGNTNERNEGPDGRKGDHPPCAPVVAFWRPLLLRGFLGLRFSPRHSWYCKFLAFILYSPVPF